MEVSSGDARVKVRFGYSSRVTGSTSSAVSGDTLPPRAVAEIGIVGQKENRHG